MATPITANIEESATSRLRGSTPHMIIKQMANIILIIILNTLTTCFVRASIFLLNVAYFTINLLTIYFIIGIEIASEHFAVSIGHRINNYMIMQMPSVKVS